MPLGTGGEVVAQHAELAEPGAGGLGIVSLGRDRHEAGDTQVSEAGQGADRLGEPLGGEAVLALLAAEVDLQEAVEGPAAGGGLAVESLGDPWPVDGVDGPEQLDRRPDLVALQGADQVPLDVEDMGRQLAALGHGLLHPVLAEDAQTGVPGRGQGGRGLGLAGAHQDHAAGRAPAAPAGLLDAVADPGEALRNGRVAVHGFSPAPPPPGRGCVCRTRTGSGCRRCGSPPPPAGGRGSCRRRSATPAASGPAAR